MTFNPASTFCAENFFENRSSPSTLLIEEKVNLTSFGGRINRLSAGKHGVASVAWVLEALTEVIASL